MSIVTDEADGGGRRRARALAALHELTDKIAVAGPDGIPAVEDGEPLAFQLRVPGGLDDEGRRAWVDQVAAAWGVRAVDSDLGRSAEWRSLTGDARLTASVADSDRTVSGHKARFASLQAANSMGATA
jgi:hypothetical protein